MTSRNAYRFTIHIIVTFCCCCCVRMSLRFLLIWDIWYSWKMVEFHFGLIVLWFFFLFSIHISFFLIHQNGNNWTVVPKLIEIYRGSNSGFIYVILVQFSCKKRTDNWLSELCSETWKKFEVEPEERFYSDDYQFDADNFFSFYAFARQCLLRIVCT